MAEDLKWRKRRRGGQAHAYMVGGELPLCGDLAAGKARTYPVDGLPRPPERCPACATKHGIDQIRKALTPLNCAVALSEGGYVGEEALEDARRGLAWALLQIQELEHLRWGDNSR